MRQPCVSVVIAAHAPRRAWLREAVSSAIAQDRCRTEAVVVDDGSPQPVAGMLEGIDNETVKVIRTTHRGAGRARDAGLAAAGGEYVRFLDADDVLPRESTARLLGCSDTSTPLAVGATRWCDSELKPLFDWQAGCPRRAAHSTLLLRSTPMLPSILFARQTLDEVGPWHERMTVGEDWDYILRALEIAPINETSAVVTLYRQHPSSASRDRAASWRDTKLAVDRFFERNPDERSRLQRRVEAMLDLLAAELSRPAAPWLERRFWRAFARDPAVIRTAYARMARPRIGTLRIRWQRLSP